MTLVSEGAAAASAAFDGTVTGGPMSVSTATLTAPTGLSVSNPCTSATAISSSLTWTASSAPATSGYSILRSTTPGGGFSQVGTVSGATTTTYTDTISHRSTADNLYVAVGTASGMDVVSMATNAKTATSTGLHNPNEIVVTPDGTTAWVNSTGKGNDTIYPINLSTDAVGTGITLSGPPGAMAITPDGSTLLVAVGPAGPGTSAGVVPITLATSTVGTPISLGFNPAAVAVTPDGSTAWLAGGPNVQSLNLATLTLGTLLTKNKAGFQGIAIAPNGASAYLVDSPGNTVWPLNLSTGTFGAGIAPGFSPAAITISPDGTTAWVVGKTDIVPITLSGPTVGSIITVTGETFKGITMSPNGCWVYAAGAAGASGNFLVPVNATTRVAGADIAVDASPSAVAAAFPPTTYYYEVEGIRNLWASPATPQVSMPFGQPSTAD